MSGIPKVNIGTSLRDFYAEDETALARLREAQKQREDARERDAAWSNANQIFGGKGRDVPRRRDAVEMLQEEQSMREDLRQRREQSDSSESLAQYLQRQGVSPEDAQVMARNQRLMQTWDAGRTRKEDREFRAGESEKDRALREREGARNRANQRGLFDARQTAAEERAQSKAAGEDIKGTDRLRGEFERAPEVKAYRDSAISLEKMEHAAGDPSAAGDLALIFSYMKVLDPGSTVREGEFATAQNAAGVDGRIQSQYNKIISGERLNPGQRSDFLRRARELHQAHRKAYDSAAQQYARLARERGANPRNVVRDAQDEGPASNSVGVRMRDVDGSIIEVDPGDVAAAEAEGAVRL